jgi:hypothetical protein
MFIISHNIIFLCLYVYDMFHILCLVTVSGIYGMYMYVCMYVWTSLRKFSIVCRISRKFEKEFRYWQVQRREKTYSVAQQQIRNIWWHSWEYMLTLTSQFRYYWKKLGQYGWKHEMPSSFRWGLSLFSIEMIKYWPFAWKLKWWYQVTDRQTRAQNASKAFFTK